MSFIVQWKNTHYVHWYLLTQIFFGQLYHLYETGQNMQKPNHLMLHKSIISCRSGVHVKSVLCTNRSSAANLIINNELTIEYFCFFFVVDLVLDISTDLPFTLSMRILDAIHSHSHCSLFAAGNGASLCRWVRMPLHSHLRHRHSVCLA